MLRNTQKVLIFYRGWVERVRKMEDCDETFSIENALIVNNLLQLYNFFHVTFNSRSIEFVTSPPPHTHTPLALWCHRMDPHTQPAPTYTSRKSTRRNKPCGVSRDLSPDSADSVWLRGRSNAGKMDSHWIDLDLNELNINVNRLIRCKNVYQPSTCKSKCRNHCPIKINIWKGINGLISMPNWEFACSYSDKSHTWYPD